MKLHSYSTMSRQITAAKIPTSGYGRTNKGIPISDAVLIKGQKSITSLAKRLKLGVGEKYIVNIVGKNADDPHLTVTDTAADSTICRYKTIWKQFTEFCIKCGDYQSTFLTYREGGIQRPFAPSLSTFCAFALYRVYQKDVPLKCMISGKPVKFKDERGKIYCAGSCRSLSGLEIISTAFSKVSNYYLDTRGEYEDVCDACLKAVKKNKAGHGCKLYDNHYNSPRITPRGSISTSSLLAAKMAILKQYIVDHYQPRHTVAYLPREIRNFRTYFLNRCVTKESLIELQAWTIMIHAVKNMLRIDEVISFTVEQFLMNYSTMIGDDLMNILTV